MIKFTDIRRNANVLLNGEAQTGIIKHSEVVAYVVSPERMAELLNYEEDAQLAEIANSRIGQDRIRVDLERVK